MGRLTFSGDMAIRMQKAFGVRMDTLMRMQASYDITQTRKREKQIHVRQLHQALVHGLAAVGYASTIPVYNFAVSVAFHSQPSGRLLFPSANACSPLLNVEKRIGHIIQR